MAATAIALEQQRTGLKQVITGIVAFDLEKDLVRAETLGREFSFEAYRQLFQDVLALYRELNVLDLARVPLNKLNNLTQWSTNVLNSLQTIRNFSPKAQPNPMNHQQNLVNNLSGYYDQAFDAISQIMAVTRERPDVSSERARFAAERITQHENKSYENFSLFLKLSTAIVGGMGVLALRSENGATWWKLETIAWALYYLEWFVTVFFSITTGLEYFAIRRQWEVQAELHIKKESIPHWHIVKHVQLYFILAMITLPIALRHFVLGPLFVKAKLPS